MSKLDRQLDEIQGTRKVEIVWPFTEQMYLTQLRAQLKKEIDSHSDRVPLDLRQVEGAPDGLIDLLFEMKEYAESRSKNLVVAYALGEMRAALGPKRPGQKVSGHDDGPNPSELARDLLTNQLTPMQSIHNSVRQQKINQAEHAKPIAARLTKIKSPALKRTVSIGLLSIAGTVLLVTGYWFYVFKLSPDSVSLEPTRKTFETSED